ncbi:hypothetical protein CXB51_005111 [Gossypium anomalum]|uniref:Aminotransferase-like plant mobile domain-containing protein n=1 Tax=Gossypium anomalum TaxID=47600 RepID=A0A8J5YY59_9ROSI|nr:hypothetical protein CXB51_005111 [Gossypium anomalum]
MPYLELAGFGSVALIRKFDFRNDLISALVERWRPETHTFHLPCGECTVTLEDVALQLGLQSTGVPLLKVSPSPNDAESKFMGLKFSWLKANFEHLSINATEHELGSTILAMLYCELCQTTKPDTVDIGECLRLEIAAVIPSSAYIHSHLWCINAPIINFHTVEWYNGDRVLWQFGSIHYISNPPMQVGKIHLINKRGKHGNNWGVVHWKYIVVWDDRMARRPQMDISSDLQPSLKYIQWYSSMGKPYLLGGQSTVVPPHMHRLGPCELVPDIRANPKLEPDPKPEPEPKPQPEPERSLTHSADSSYHLKLQYSTPPRSYPSQYGTPPGSSSSTAPGAYDFSSMFHTPPPATEEDVDRQNHSHSVNVDPRRNIPLGPHHQTINFRGFL